MHYITIILQTVGLSTVVAEWACSWIFADLGTNLEVWAVILFWAQICPAFKSDPG